MARKNLLAGLGDDKLPAGNFDHSRVEHSAETPHLSFGSRGAIGAVSRSIENLKAQAVVELEPDLIDPPKVVDRLDEGSTSFAEFAEQIRQAGQQVPVLVRPHPDHQGRYQIAYGRRRLRAVKLAGRLVKAVVKPLSDDELVLAQGQENSQRKDLSFIERALYAAELEAGGVKREVIMSALGVDKTGLSKLISVADQVPHDFIRVIGPAPKVGRDRWLEFAARLQMKGALDRLSGIIESDEFRQAETDDRFSRLFSALAPKRAAKPRLQAWKAEDGTSAARYKQDERLTTIVIDRKTAPEFGDFVIASLDDLYEAYRKSRND